MAYLYQEIMKVPGLSGSWQERNKALYNKLGSPQGPYTGSYSQNIWLLNQLKNNNYYQGGLPGTQSSQQGDNVLKQFTDPTLSNVKVDDRVYSQDVMSPEQWRAPFDAWTQNFIDTYVKPEWEQNVYNPAMKKMTETMNTANQNVGATGAWRTGGARNSLRDMAEQAVRDEENLKQQFNNQTTEIRNSVYDQWADPLYKSNMSRFVTAPWRDLDLGTMASNEISNMGQSAWDEFLNGLSQKGVSFGNINNPNDAINSLNTWDPSYTPDTTKLNWGVTPNQFGKMGTNVFKQYLGLEDYPTPAPTSSPGKIGLY